VLPSLDLLPGNYEVKVYTSFMGQQEFVSDGKVMTVKPFKWRLAFDTLECKTQYWSPFHSFGGGALFGNTYINTPPDAIFTQWVVIQDITTYGKRSASQNFSDGTTHQYGGDGIVFGKNGMADNVGQGLAFSTQLFLLTGDNQSLGPTASDALGSIMDIAAVTAEMMYGKEAGMVVEYVGEVLTAAVSLFEDTSSPAPTPPFAIGSAQSVQWSLRDICNLPQGSDQATGEVTFESPPYTGHPQATKYVAKWTLRSVAEP
jgi:hypothetical protein